MINIEELYQSCKDKRSFDKAIIKELKADPNLKQKLKEYMVSQKFSDDEKTLFNWCIGVGLNVSVNEL